jgi:hypothetical protein
LGRAHDDRIETPGWAADLPALLPLAKAALAMSQAAVQEAGSDGCCPSPAFIRCDGDLENVARTASGQVMFLDWGCSGLGDPAFDLAELRWHPRGLFVDAKHWDSALATYGTRSGDASLATRLNVYMQLLPAWWIARSLLHLVEGVAQGSGRTRARAVPRRMYFSVRKQLDRYLAALRLIQLPEGGQETDEE